MAAQTCCRLHTAAFGKLIQTPGRHHAHCTLVGASTPRPKLTPLIRLSDKREVSALARAEAPAQQLAVEPAFSDDELPETPTAAGEQPNGGEQPESAHKGSPEATGAAGGGAAVGTDADQGNGERASGGVGKDTGTTEIAAGMSKPACCNLHQIGCNLLQLGDVGQWRWAQTADTVEMGSLFAGSNKGLSFWCSTCCPIPPERGTIASSGKQDAHFTCGSGAAQTDAMPVRCIGPCGCSLFGQST